MYIHEAILSRSLQKPYIRRRSWERISPNPGIAIKLLPTTSPDGCIIESDLDGDLRRTWMPTAADLVADDWEVVGL